MKDAEIKEKEIKNALNKMLEKLFSYNPNKYRKVMTTETTNDKTQASPKVKGSTNEYR